VLGKQRAQLGRVRRRLDGLEVDPGVVFAGLGDPLLRLDTLLEAAEGIRDVVPGVALRVSTNGLVPAAAAQEVAVALHTAGIDEVTVALNAADPASYAAQMLTPPAYAPPYFESASDAIGETGGAGFSEACAFVVALSESGVPVTATCVAKPGVDTAACRTLAFALGATAFKERSWHE